MSRKLFASAGIIATAVGAALFAAPAATAAPAPASSASVDCLTCWGSPKAASFDSANLGALVGTALRGTRVG